MNRGLIKEGGCQVSVLALGSSLGLLAILYFIRGTNGRPLGLLKLLIPLFLSLGVMTLGIGLLRGETDSGRVLAVAVSGVTGVLLMGLVSAWMFAIQRLEGTSNAQSRYLVLSNLCIGAAIGTVLGVYRVRLQQRSDQLSREVNRLNEFAGIVAHDLRNPLHIAQGYLAQIPHEGHDDELASIERAHARMERLIDQVLALSRRGETVGETTTVDASSVAEAAWTDVPTEEAELRIQATDYVVEADQRRLRSLFENLFRNAIEHGDAATVTVGTLENGFFVADDGVGIPSKYQERVFEGGFSTEDTGTGLGLAIVRQIADAHGWSVTVTESVTGGARFEFTAN